MEFGFLRQLLRRSYVARNSLTKSSGGTWGSRYTCGCVRAHRLLCWIIGGACFLIQLCRLKLLMTSTCRLYWVRHTLIQKRSVQFFVDRACMMLIASRFRLLLSIRIHIDESLLSWDTEICDHGEKNNLCKGVLGDAIVVAFVERKFGPLLFKINRLADLWSLGRNISFFVVLTRFIFKLLKSLM